MKILITSRKTIFQNQDYYSISSEWINFFQMKNLDYNVAIVGKNYDVNDYDGIILSGGGNVSSNKLVKNPEEYDFERENIEKNLINDAISNNIPLLGVCRGYQKLVSEINGDKKLFFKSNYFQIFENYLINLKNVNLNVTCYNDYIFENLNFDIWEVTSQDSKGFYTSVKHKKFKLLGCIWHPEREKNVNDQVWNEFLKWMT